MQLYNGKPLNGHLTAGPHITIYIDGLAHGTYRTYDGYDNSELLAQGRFLENAKNKREVNRYPLFDPKKHWPFAHPYQR